MEKSKSIRINLSWPCYACGFNNREDYDHPCNICDENVSSDHLDDNYGKHFDPIIDPK